MYLNLLLWLCLLLAPLGTAMAEDNGSGAEEPAAKELSGISIVGNDEAPKSLYIVPWKGSEIGAGTSMGMELSNSAVPVDRDVFMRQLEFYKVSNKK